MATTLTSLETHHEEMIHDAQLDYYGKRLATASSDRTIKIFEIGEKQNNCVAELKGHEGPVWQVAWAHPSFGSLLASCSYDKRVIIWSETATNQFTKVFEYSHDGSVNSLAFASPEYGFMLASCSSDRSIFIVTQDSEKKFETKRIEGAHDVGINAISWSPASASKTRKDDKKPLFVTGGCDNIMKIWKFSEENWASVFESHPDIHQEWVRDVAWAPNIGLPDPPIASCSQNGLVLIWRPDEQGNWKPKTLKQMSDVVWRLSWSVTSSILAVSSADNKVTLWKENLEGEWKCISSLDE